MSINDCPICTAGLNKPVIAAPIEKYDCQRCGFFEADNGAIFNRFDGKKITTPRQRANISGWIRENQGRKIDYELFESLLELPTPTIAERGAKVLKWLNQHLDEAGDYVRWENDFFLEVLGIASASSRNELYFILYQYLLHDRKFVDAKLSLSNYDSETQVTITPAGYSYLDSMKQVNPNTNKAFCAMWFDNRLSSLWEQAIKLAIDDSGYDPKIIYEKPYNGGIVDEILSEIRSSKFIIADLTGNRGGVYYESGFATGLGLPVIFTCEKTLVKEKKLHFDVSHYNNLCWEKEKYGEFRHALANHIIATLGHGKLNIIA